MKNNNDERLFSQALNLENTPLLEEQTLLIAESAKVLELLPSGSGNNLLTSGIAITTILALVLLLHEFRKIVEAIRKD